MDRMNDMLDRYGECCTRAVAAKYIDQPAQHNLEARQKKAMLKRKSNWSV